MAPPSKQKSAFQKLLGLFDLEQLDRDLFLGDPGPGQGRLFGGLVAAQSALAASRAAPLAAPGATIDPMAGVPGASPQVPAGQAFPAQPIPPQIPGASVSTFGGPDGNGGQ